MGQERGSLLDRDTPSLGAKRPALFRNLYQVCDQDNVSIVDMNKTPVTKILPNGIVTVDGAIQEIDAIILVTGFDAITGDLKAINIINSAGETLSEKWSNGTWTNLGLKSHDSRLSQHVLHAWTPKTNGFIQWVNIF
ncbi:hypothetical protein H9Q69_013292 [Fusarium xylarioides]|uniref:Monooxygenase n=1 Tax=Fusarium xylarioides TaxID=221167 RepID=A0A9P7HBB0_9HYPO|nr:hypothetical protein H9Q72_014175 [Fusarium xylarioides]KAG5787644.1 hypothetical protein H9Q69_013292 [Fusarium xylarioides]KAG5801609.1 hypothetical protein H9Q71_013808 [Fusarium xylarioides]KAG5812227.1 hypothetical protein H9Q74_013210 [Fusarium xylarioides]